MIDQSPSLSLQYGASSSNRLGATDAARSLAGLGSPSPPPGGLWTLLHPQNPPQHPLPPPLPLFPRQPGAGGCDDGDVWSSAGSVWCSWASVFSGCLLSQGELDKRGGDVYWGATLIHTLKEK